MAEKKIKYNKEDVEKLVSLLEQRKKNKKKNENFTKNFTASYVNEKKNHKFHTTDTLYELNITREKDMSFISFIQSLYAVFTYLLNVARASVRNDGDHVRFIFENAPRTFFLHL